MTLDLPSTRAYRPLFWLYCQDCSEPHLMVYRLDEVEEGENPAEDRDEGAWMVVGEDLVVVMPMRWEDVLATAERWGWDVVPVGQPRCLICDHPIMDEVLPECRVVSVGEEDGESKEAYVCFTCRLDGGEDLVQDIAAT